MQACAWEYDPLLVKVWIIADGLKFVASQVFYSTKVESNHLTVVKSFVKKIIKLNEWDGGKSCGKQFDLLDA